MGFWNKLKKLLGIARVVSPDVNRVLAKAEDAGRAALITKESADQVKDVVDRLQADQLVGESFTPSSVCPVTGIYGLVRRGELVVRWDGHHDTAGMERGERFPPGLEPGDRWRRFAR